MIPADRGDLREGLMRGSDERTGELFSYVDIEERVPRNHPLRLIRRIVNEVLAALDGEFAKLYADDGRPSIDRFGARRRVAEFAARRLFATLLGDRGRWVRNQTAAQESVRDPAGEEQIGGKGEQ
jgi:hypothetical protein